MQLTTIKLQSLLPHIASITSLLLVIVCAHALARMTWMLFPEDESAASTASLSRSFSQNPASRKTNNVGQLAAAHLFGKMDAAIANTTQVATETRLNLVLRGVLATDTAQYASAIIANGKNGKEELYSINDVLPGNASLREIHAEHVILERGGQLEILKLTKDEGLGLTIESDSNDSTGMADTAEALGDIRKEIMQNPTKFGDYALPVVVNEGGKQIGYRLEPQEGGKELLAQVGLEPNDVITSINGVKLDNPKNGITVLRDLTTAQSINITVKRNGSEVPLNIQLQ